jgi:hypothetical protein
MPLNDALELMDAFAERTGLSSDAEPRRYLWTDAFALVNLLELHQRTKGERFSALARDLVDQVHSVLGRHRSDDFRAGWLSGLSEGVGAAHPTAGGLRIGKPLPERGLTESPNERLEWERDGQYFHYLTKWMDALCRAGSILGERPYHQWAAELAKSVLPRFLQKSSSGAPLGLAWKMSIDLSRSQVSGLSPHDSLDGYVTFRWLEAVGAGPPSLGEETDVLSSLLEDRRWGSSDPLGIGGLLLVTLRLAHLPDPTDSDGRLIGRLLSGIADGLHAFVDEGVLRRPSSQRLGFRELGLSIGLQGIGPVAAVAERSPALAAAAGRYLPALKAASVIGVQIADFWSEHRHQQGPTWQEHRDINDVMLATALLKAQVGTLGKPRGN